MKKTVLGLLIITATLYSGQIIKTGIDLVNIKDDKVAVTMEFPEMRSQEVNFHFPKTVPGTYSVDDYGRFIEDIKFLDGKGKELAFTKTDDNTYTLKKGKGLKKVTYWVNDSFDEENITDQHKAVFSPSGTNIEEEKVYMINTHGFVGYVSNMQNIAYQLTIQKPSGFYGTTALVDRDQSELTDTFSLINYAKLVDSPIMYSKPDYIEFNVENMNLVLGVYSPSGKYKAADFKERLQEMVVAQKKFLGSMNTNKKYAVLLYLADFTGKGPMVKGFGALEHHESTTVVMPEMMSKDQIEKTLTDVVSHEFFHTVSPLKTHSEQIHNFDFADPKMSKHLWMYEGGTEYFANLFQVQEGLIDRNEFLKRVGSKITNSKNFNDTMPFTVMSENILLDAYKDQYPNVYEKGMLLAMCMDIELRRLSDGKMGYREMIEKLSQKFGENRPFRDSQLIDELVTITGFPQVREFYDKYIAGDQPAPYNEYLKMVGIVFKEGIEKDPFWFVEGHPITLQYNSKNKTITFNKESVLTATSKNIGLKIDDEIVSIDGKIADFEKISEFLDHIQKVKDSQRIQVTVLRKEGEITKKINLEGQVVLQRGNEKTLQFEENATVDEVRLREQWLSGIKL